ncbi:MAG: hypothetical protein CL843_03555 [Crocinitomicaceae bacterium]|nr:hypothetical protein [Crocinitomicaceae bacterium]
MKFSWKIRILIMVISFVGCSENDVNHKVKSSIEEQIDLSNFKTSHYNRLVESLFVKAFKEQYQSSEVNLFVVQGLDNQCDECLNGMYQSLINRLPLKDDHKIIILTNRQEYVKDLKNVEYKVLPELNNQVKHNKIYYYKIEQNKVVFSEPVNADFMDRMNGGV